MSEEKKSSKLGLIIGLGLVAVLTMGLMMYVSASNNEVRLRAVVNAEQKVCQANFDKMWKILQEQAQVADQYKEGFADIFVKMTDARYANDNSLLFKFITESNPNFDVSLYSTLQKSIASERTSFTIHQEKLIDVAREHSLLINTIPSSWFVGSRGEIEIQLVTSSRTKEAFRTGEDNDVELFKDKK